MFNFQNLDSSEFEKLSKDILNKATNLNFRTYAKGRDGGIDISSENSRDGFGQVKHYMTSDINTLIRNLKKELTNVVKINPKQYYIFTSRSLSESRISELYNHFSKYMASSDNIYDGTRIEDLLNEDSYADIVRKHTKLWLTSNHILELINNKDIFIDTSVLLSNIRSERELYVITNEYKKALQIMFKNKVLLITGSAGSGKTTLSKLLLLTLHKSDFSVKYATSNSIKDIKKSLSSNNNNEIIFIDDFLGQYYKNLNENTPNEINSLIQFIQNQKHKYLILNSRQTILNHARRTYHDFNHLLNNIDKDSIFSIGSFTDIEKTQLLYNHLKQSKISIELFNNLAYKNNFAKIILHNNFNPRVIEFATNTYDANTNTEILAYFLKCLENPELIWINEFENKLSDDDRNFMYIFYSLTDTYVDFTALNDVYDKLLLLTNSTTTINMIENCITRLKNSFIQETVIDNNRYYSVINPSVNEFLHSYIMKNKIIQRKLMDTILYYEQIYILDMLKLVNCKDYIDNCIKTDCFRSLKSFKSTTGVEGIFFIISSSKITPQYLDLLHNLILEPQTYLFRGEINTTVVNDVYKTIRAQSYIAKLELSQFHTNNNLMNIILDFLDTENFLFLVDKYDLNSTNRVLDDSSTLSDINISKITTRYRKYHLQDIISTLIADISDFFYNYFFDSSDNITLEEAIFEITQFISGHYTLYSYITEANTALLNRTTYWHTKITYEEVIDVIEPQQIIEDYFNVVDNILSPKSSFEIYDTEDESTISDLSPSPTPILTHHMLSLFQEKDLENGKTF